MSTPRTVTTKWEIAGAGFRVLGALIDSFVWWAIAFAIVAVIRVTVGAGGESNVRLLNLASPFAWFVTDVVMVTLFGFSPGKWFIGTRVSQSAKTFEKPNVRAAFIRWTAKFAIPFLIISLLPIPVVGTLADVVEYLTTFVVFISIMSNLQRRGFHDRWAGTFVLRRRYSQS